MRMASTVKLAVGPGGCLTAATPGICASFQGQVAQMRTDEIVIGLSDQCDRNYSLDRSRSDPYYASNVEPVPDGELGCARAVCLPLPPL